MKNLNKRNSMKKYLLTLLVVFAFIGAFAQPGQGGQDNDTPGTPIDGGIVVLVVGGAVYGLKKIKKN